MKTNFDTPWGDSIDTIKYSKPLDEWYNVHPKLNYNYFKLPSYYSFDINEMQKQVELLLDNNEALSIDRNADGKKYNRYRGLGFFSRENAINPLSDHFVRRDANVGLVYSDDLYLPNQLPELYENDFNSPTSIYNDYFKNVFSVFKSQTSKASILELRRKGYLSSHVDFPYYRTIRLHSTIKGGENAWYEVNGDKFQIPADGNWYFFDTGKYHSAWNEGPDDRLTININLKIAGDPLILANANLL
jgi:hypothetical protein